MLGERKIVSFSQELGVSDVESSLVDTFYPNIQTTGKIIISENLNGAIYMIQKAGYYLE